MSSTTLTIFSAFFGLLPLLVLVFIFVFVISIFRRVERRAEERLKIEKESAQLQQQQIQEINKRLTTIETILKQVD
ncbi:MULTISPECIES: hypothetical protein [Lysinibacillus]|uniref:hypothetical protein n=1 Tax=Lysinibacillus TaxID=400634 RepID=UPI00214C77AB|nr:MULTISPECIES: hypothetical protein [Lysinibacillus]UNT53392.1 hypothetical protein ICJ70_12595 [Lysinibacillus capsici]UUV26869.1 hypothetical protein NP781_09930 [Lysinibacillus sp. FN11]UYB49760.1 hypothetical protein OCI51_12600 [Lysinibacillus capsici]